MMKWKPFTKRLLSLVLAIVMIAGVLPVTSMAAETEEHDHSAETQAAAQTVETQAAEQPKEEQAAQPNAMYTYTLTFNGNGDNVTGVPAMKTVEVPDSPFVIQIEFSDIAGITRPGYTFKGWNSQKDGNGTTYNPGMTSVPVSADAPNATVYAKWESNAPTPPIPSDPPIPTNYTYQLIFDDGVDDGSVTGMPANQSSPSTTAKSYNFNIPNQKPSRPNYDFSGYYTAEGRRYAQGWSITLNSDNPTVTLTARWQEHTAHVWEYTMDSDGKDGTHSATCTVTWNNGTVKCTETLVNQPHTWSGKTTKSATFTEPGVKTYTCTKCGATYEEEIPVVVPSPLTPSDVAKVNQGRYVWIVENYNVNADGNGGAPKWFPGANDREEAIKTPRSADEYTITDPVYDAATDAYYCTLTIKKEVIQGWIEYFQSEGDWKVDWAHSHYKSLQDFTFVLSKTHPTMGWAIDKTRSGMTGNDAFGKAIFMVHTNHYNRTVSDWKLDPEKNVMYARCSVHAGTTDAYRCNVMLYEPVAPDVQPLLDQLDQVTLYVDGVETEIIPESILTTKAAVAGDETGWYTYVNINGEMYLGQCRRFASGQSNKPSIRFKLVPGEGDDELHGTWVLDQTTVEIKTVPFHTFSIVEVTKEPTCAKGEKKYTCEKCGETKIEEIPAVAEHTWTDWVVTQQPTPEKEGLKERICQNCGEKDSEVLPKAMPAPPTENFLWTLYRGYIINAIENYNVLADGTAGAPKTVSGSNGRAFRFSAEPGTYDLSEVKVNDDGEYYCTLTVTDLQYYADMYGEEYEDSVDRYAIDTLHTDADSFTYVLKWNGHAWYYDETNFNAAAGKNLYMVHTRHSSNDAWTVVKEATCEEEGLRTRRCSHLAAARADYTRCNYIIQEVIPVTDHTWTEWVVTTPATCTTDGVEMRICQKCGQKESRTIPAAGEHTWGEWEVTREATCAKEGEKSRTCTVCGTVETEAIEKTEHIWNEGRYLTKPSPWKNGQWIYSCTVCHATKIVDIPKLEEYELPEKPTAEDILGLNYKLNVKEFYEVKFSTGKPQLSYKGRSISNILLADTFEIGEVYEEGEGFYVNVTINKLDPYISLFTDKFATEDVSYVRNTTYTKDSYVLQLGYDGFDYPYADISWYVVRNLTDTSDIWMDHVHYTTGSWTTVKNATCTEDGIRSAVCSHWYQDQAKPSTNARYLCKETFEEAIPATGHTWGEWTSDGENHTRTCSACGEVETGAHKWDKGVITVAPHLDSEGEKTYTCSVCNGTKTEVMPVPVPVTNEIVEHERQNPYIYILENSKPAGQSPYYIGNINNEKLGRQVTYRGLLPGTYSIGKPYEENGKFYCIVTITDINAYLETFRAKFTDANYIIDTAASKTTYQYRLEYIGYDHPADSCAWRMLKTLPDENGKDTNRLWITHTHYADNMTVTTPATCTKDGIQSGTCKHSYKVGGTTIKSWNCLQTFEETIPATGEHSWGEWEVTKEATCEAEGEKTRVCSVCNETEIEKVPALGHDWDEGKVTTEATCTKEGVKTFTCKNDSTHTKTEAIPVKDHTYSKWESDETNHWRKCSECGKKQTGKHRDADNNGVCDVCGKQVGKSDTAPKTGDPAPVKTVVTVLVISAVAICAIAAYLFLKKKKASDQ